ncbi:hypothetical protein [Rhizobium sp. HT1-10]|uniref:hypothetical protein n=1 Tax=Rhizobium sp. HT1-10 TaxID=3111638 RepID=UPI003C20E339
MMLISIWLFTAFGVHSSWLAVFGGAEKTIEWGERPKKRQKTILLPLLKQITARKVWEAPEMAIVERALGSSQCNAVVGNHWSIRHLSSPGSHGPPVCSNPDTWKATIACLSMRPNIV